MEFGTANNLMQDTYIKKQTVWLDASQHLDVAKKKFWNVLTRQDLVDPQDDWRFYE